MMPPEHLLPEQASDSHAKVNQGMSETPSQSTAVALPKCYELQKQCSHPDYFHPRS